MSGQAAREQSKTGRHGNCHFSRGGMQGQPPRMGFVTKGAKAVVKGRSNTRQGLGGQKKRKYEIRVQLLSLTS